MTAKRPGKGVADAPLGTASTDMPKTLVVSASARSNTVSGVGNSAISGTFAPPAATGKGRPGGPAVIGWGSGNTICSPMTPAPPSTN